MGNHNSKFDTVYQLIIYQSNVKAMQFSNWYMSAIKAHALGSII